MISFIPLTYYTTIYYNIILLIIILTWLHTQQYSGFTRKTFTFNKVSANFLLWFVLLYMGLRPVSYAFGDMGSYAKVFKIYASGGDPEIGKDMAFYGLMRFIANFQSPVLFFFIIALLYTVPLYIAVKRWFPNYYYFAFLILVASFSFWAYGTNGLRNGVAMSLLILAFSYKDKKIVQYALFALAFLFHSSALLPIAAFVATRIYQHSKLYFIFWFLSILLSVSIGSFFEGTILKLGIVGEDKLQMYFGEKELYEDSFSSTGFRWDFLLYSAMAVFVAYYFIHVKKFKDKHYIQLTNIYLLTNAFWILVIRASFSNRFAYLSWYMMGIVIIYPFLKQVYWKNQFSRIGFITLLYFSFTYFMFVIIG